MGYGDFSFDTLLARYECTKKTRPPAQPRFGSVCERLFGEANTQFLHNLAGNTQMTKSPRQLTRAVDPKRHAVWTLAALYERLCDLREISSRIHALGRRWNTIEV